MKTKNEIKKLFEKINENEESLLVVHVDENDDFGSFVCGETAEIGAGIATIVYDGFKLDANEDIRKLADAIIDGVACALQVPSLSSVQIMLRLTEAITQSKKSLQKKMKDEFDSGKDDDAYDSENCEDCDNNRWCPLPDAVAYRKENHIPAPHKRKNGKRGGKKNENVN